MRGPAKINTLCMEETLSWLVVSTLPTCKRKILMQINTGLYPSQICTGMVCHF